jgi:purine-cytosine permease-like protein
MRLIIAGVVVVAIVAAGAILAPDIARYLKIRAM